MTGRVESGSLEAIVRPSDEGTLISVRVTPRASASEFVGVAEGRLRVRLQAPPVEGAANEALIALLAKACGLPKNAVSVLRGETGREKTIRVLGRSSEDVIDILKKRLPE
jgi:uncharacterized protein (TIGR00251 family)